LKWLVTLTTVLRYRTACDGHLKFFQEGSSRNRGQSSIGPQYYTNLISYVTDLIWLILYYILYQACGLDLGLRQLHPGLLSSVIAAPVCVAALMMRHHSDDNYMTSQPIAAHSSAAV